VPRGFERSEAPSQGLDRRGLVGVFGLQIVMLGLELPQGLKQLSWIRSVHFVKAVRARMHHIRVR
jgi:hypothetical protein